MLRSAASDSAVDRMAAAPAPATSGRGSVMLGVLALVALAFVTFVYPSATRQHAWPFAAVVFALSVFPVLVLLFGILRGATWRLPPPAVRAGIAILALGAVVSAVTSPFSPASFARIWPTWGGCALYLWLHHLWSDPLTPPTDRSRRVVHALAGAGVIFTVISLVFGTRGTWPYPWTARNPMPFGHSVYTAGALLLLLPWLASAAWLNRGARRLAWIVAGAAMLLTLASTGSRGAVLALAFSALLGVATMVASSSWRRRHKIALVGGALAVTTIAVLANARLRHLVIHRQWGVAELQSNEQRQSMLVAGWKLGLERPLLGWGPGSVPLAYPQVRASLDGGTENVLQLHNTPAQLWATLGTAGLAALALLVGGTLHAIRRAPPSPSTLAAAAGLCSYGVMALLDHQLDIPAFTTLAAVNLAVLTAAARAPAPTAPHRASRIAASLLISGGLAVALAPTLRDLSARRHYDAALTALGTGDGDAYLAALDRATSVAPHDPYFQHRAAAWLLEQRAAAPDPARHRSLARDAAARLERSLASGVHQEFAHFTLGWVNLDLGQPDRAARHFAAAARLVPDKGGVYFGLGLAHEAAGRRPAAVRAFALELINDPRHLTSPTWEVPTLAPLRADARAEALTLLAGLVSRAPRASAVSAWQRWWSGEPVPPDDRLTLATPTAARLAATLSTLEAGGALPEAVAGESWARVYTAWRASRDDAATAPPASKAFLALVPGNEALATTLARRAQRHRAAFRDFLTAPVGEDDALVRTYRRQRSGYGVLTLHPAGPPLLDLYVVQENRLVTEIIPDLFPPKGWLPGRALLALLPDDPR
jgi:O-antigen ligase/tetratricopeptide (TPR) repeat protein